MIAKNTPDQDEILLREIITTRFSKEHIAGFQRIRRELFQDIASLPSVIRYCAIGGMKRELNRLRKNPPK